MPPLHSMESRLAASWPPSAWHDVTVLLAVSGGPDSVALLRAMATLKGGGRGRLRALHVNHRLRAEQSDADEPLSMAQLCKRLMNESELVARVESRRYVTAADLARELADLIRPRTAQEGIS